MADNTNKLAVDGLEFYEIKTRLKQFLSSQDKFKDYNFEGSGLSILIDLLAYNTHYINYYSNMVANEMFLDTATVRDSVVSHSKLLGYTPTSMRGARAQVSVTVQANDDGGISSEFLPRYSIFMATSGSSSFSFRTIDTYKFEPKTYDQDGKTTEYWIPEVELVEGRSGTTTYIVDRNQAQRFVIPEETVDVSTLKVRVQNSVTNISGYDEYWTLVSDPVQLQSDSMVYFIQETENNKYEVYFGDDLVGKGIKNGNIVILEYLVSMDDPTTANGIGSLDTDETTSFTLQASEFGESDVVTLDQALGGADRESIDSIKYYAPRGFQAQDRAVTVEDYAFMLSREYPFAQSIYVWGGEDNDPPVYGRVYISIKPVRGTSLTNQEKESIKIGILKRFNIVGVTPEIVDPDYTYLKFQTTVKMNPAKTTKTPNEVKQVVKNSISSYVNDNLGKFGGNLLFSRLSSIVDSSDTSVEASGMVITLQKDITPNYGVETNYTSLFANAIEPETISTNAFLHLDDTKQNTTDPYSLAYLKDDGAGTINVVTYDSSVSSGTGTESGTGTGSGTGTESGTGTGSGTGSGGTSAVAGNGGTSTSITGATLTGTTTVTVGSVGGGAVERIIKKNAGKIDYTKGKISLTSFNISGLSGINPVLQLLGRPSNFAEIVADKNQLLSMKNDDPTSNFVDVRLSTDGRLNSPSTVKNQPSFQTAKVTTAPVASSNTSSASQNAAAAKETKPKAKGYPKC